MDLFADFLDSECVIDPKGLVYPSKLYNAYIKYCRDIGEQRDITETAFGRVVNLMFPKKKIGGYEYRIGLYLKHDDQFSINPPKSSRKMKSKKRFRRC
jgi:phage/plasmid-associated DNA primase